MRALRYSKDWHDVWQSLCGHIALLYLPRPAVPAAAVTAAILFKKRQQLVGPVRTLLRLMPGMVLGIAGGCVLCALEMWLARHLGRQNMSQEILRGTRFLVPLSWLLLTCLFVPVLAGPCPPAAPWHRHPAGCRPAVAGAGQTGGGGPACPGGHDRSGLAGYGRGPADQGAFPGIAGCPAGPRAQAGPEELVFTDGDCMAVRFAARMPMLPVHSDGTSSIMPPTRIWPGAGWPCNTAWRPMPPAIWEVWRTEQAALLLTRHVEHKALLLRYGALLFENEDWLLLRRSPVAADADAQVTRSGYAD